MSIGVKGIAPERTDAVRTAVDEALMRAGATAKEGFAVLAMAYCDVAVASGLTHEEAADFIKQAYDASVTLGARFLVVNAAAGGDA